MKACQVSSQAAEEAFVTLVTVTVTLLTEFNITSTKVMLMSPVLVKHGGTCRYKSPQLNLNLTLSPFRSISKQTLCLFLS